MSGVFNFFFFLKNKVFEIIDLKFNLYLSCKINMRKEF